MRKILTRGKGCSECALWLAWGEGGDSKVDYCVVLSKASRESQPRLSTVYKNVEGQQSIEKGYTPSQ